MSKKLTVTGRYYDEVQVNLHSTLKQSKGAKTRDRYNQEPHLSKDTNGKVTTSQLDTRSKSQDVNHIPAGDHMSQISRRAQRHNKHKTEHKTEQT